MNIGIIGAGNHARVLLDCLRANNKITIVGIFDADPALFGKKVNELFVIENEDHIFKHHPIQAIQLINGIGSVGLPLIRKKVFNKFKNAGYYFLDIIHPTAYIAEHVVIGEGSQIMAGCVVQPGCRINNNVIINTRAAVDHDCYIGDHVHIAPGVTCCGNVEIGAGSHIGCGAVITQGVKIGEGSFIAAGAVVTKHIPAHSKVAGIPAKNME